MITILVGSWIFFCSAAVMYPLYHFNLIFSIGIAATISILTMLITWHGRTWWQKNREKLNQEEKKFIAELISNLIGKYESHTIELNEQYSQLFNSFLQQQQQMDERQLVKTNLLQETLAGIATDSFKTFYSAQQDGLSRQESLMFDILSKNTDLFQGELKILQDCQKEQNKHVQSLYFAQQESLSRQENMMLEILSKNTDLLQEKIKILQNCQEEQDKYIQRLNDTYTQLFELFFNSNKDKVEELIQKTKDIEKTMKVIMENLSDSLDDSMDNMKNIMKQHKELVDESLRQQRELLAGNILKLENCQSTSNEILLNGVKQQEELVSLIRDSYNQMRELNQKDTVLLERIIDGINDE